MTPEEMARLRKLDSDYWNTKSSTYEKSQNDMLAAFSDLLDEIERLQKALERCDDLLGTV